MKPKKPATKKYGFCEPLIEKDRVWKLDIIRKHNEKSKEAVLRVSRKFATKYQLEQLALYQLKEQEKAKK